MVDFLSASLIIILCLVILLPKVHDSFQSGSNNDNNLPHAHNLHQQDDLLEISTTSMADNLTTYSDTDVWANNETLHHDHAHHHQHSLPLGEVIICVGFFIFYILGMGLSKAKESQSVPLLMGERKISTVCCSSTRCPASQREALDSTGESDSKNKSHEEMLEGAHLFKDTQDESCVLLLNRHHRHHTHNKHHEHQSNNKSRRTTNSNYGSTSTIRVNKPKTIQDVVDSEDENKKNKSSVIYVEEIKVTRLPVTSEGVVVDDEDLNWPLSIKVTISCLIIAAVLILFDADVHGFVEAMNIFRAATTGAILYMAFFLILPRKSPGCRPCSKEEA